MSSAKLTYPQPPARPGETPDFSLMDIPAAGLLDVPSLSITADECAEYAKGLIRVLDDEGRAVGPWAEYAKTLGDDILLTGLRDMALMRAIDTRLLNAQRQGKTSFYVQCKGEEAIGCGFQRQLSDGDMNFPTYRQQSLLVAAEYPLWAFLGQLYSNAFDPLEGRQLPIMHSARDYGFFSISGNLGTQFVQAVGWAMANALTGNDQIAAGWIGDGATASNDFNAAMLSASTYQPPVVLNIVNNQWAISTFTGVARGKAKTYAQRARGYGIPALRVDGNDYLAVAAVSHWAVARARAGHGPIVIEWFTYRAAGHSTSDDPSGYRAKDEAAAWPLGDPLLRLKDYMIAQALWTEERDTQMNAEMLDHVTTAQKTVESGGTMIAPKPMSRVAVFEGVYAEMPWHLRQQRQDAGY
ncbi:MAG: thiamine pyrophosphate-dependent enzyme [Pseudoruegeria sp.]